METTMNTHRLLLALSLVLLSAASTTMAQPWLAELEAKRTSEPSFEEIRNAFNEYMKGRDYDRKTGFKHFKRWEWFMNNHLDANGRFDSRAYWNGWEEKKARFRNSTLDEADWQAAGPFLTRDFYAGGMGRLNFITFHPTNPNILYVGAASGGVWKTEDHGLNWTPLTDDLPLLGVSDLAIDYTNPDVLYLATGDRDGFALPAVGLLKSVDGGMNWSILDVPFDGMAERVVTRIVIHPTNPSRLVAATTSGLYSTSDAGETWNTGLIWNMHIQELTVNPMNPDYWFASTAGIGTAFIFTSSDGGLTWTDLDPRALGELFFTERMAMAYSPVNPARLYFFGSAFHGDFDAFWTSSDNGETWTQMSTSPNILGWTLDGSDLDVGQGHYDLTLVADPTDEGTVYIGGINIWKSADYGATWQIMTHWLQDQPVAFVHADHHELEFHGDTLYSCNDGGLYYSTDHGVNWTDISSGLVITQIYRLGTYQNSEEFTHALIGNQDNGTSLHNSGIWTSEIGGDGMECGFDPVNADTMYGEVYFGLMLKSVDGGQTWYECNNGSDTNGDWITPIHISHTTPGRLLKATSIVYESNDCGNNWSAISAEDMWTGYPIQIMGVAPSNDSTIYTTRHDASDFFVTHDKGNTWEFLSSPNSPIPYMTDIAVHPTDPMVVYVTIGRYLGDMKVYRSIDGCHHWENLSDGLPNVPVNCIEIHPDAPSHLYVGTDAGVFFSHDGGESWQDYSTGLPNVIVSELEIHRNSNTLVAATYGRGMWVSPAESPVAIDVPVNPVAEVTNTGMVTFSWENPAGLLDEFIEFMVYKDGEELERTTNTQITHQLSDTGRYVFRVRALYDEGLSDLSVPAVADWHFPEAAKVMEAVPSEYALLPACPNPFNPSTTVTLSLPEASFAEIKVYSVLGKEVAVLQDGKLSPGFHEFTFNGASLSSGVYFIKANVPGMLDVSRKVVLVK